MLLWDQTSIWQEQDLPQRQRGWILDLTLQISWSFRMLALCFKCPERLFSMKKVLNPWYILVQFFESCDALALGLASWRGTFQPWAGHCDGRLSHWRRGFLGSFAIHPRNCMSEHLMAALFKRFFTRIHNCPFGFKCNFYDGYWCPCPTVCRVAAMTLPGKEVVQSPRAVLKAQVAEAKKRGYVFKSGVEALFWQVESSKPELCCKCDPVQPGANSKKVHLTSCRTMPWDAVRCREAEFFLLSSDKDAISDSRDTQSKPCCDLVPKSREKYHEQIMKALWKQERQNIFQYFQSLPIGALCKQWGSSNIKRKRWEVEMHHAGSSKFFEFLNYLELPATVLNSSSSLTTQTMHSRWWEDMHSWPTLLQPLCANNACMML